MSSSRQEELASLLRALRERSALAPQAHTLTTPVTNSVLRLLSIIYNIHLPTTLPMASRPLTVLEEVVRITAPLAGFPQPVQQLAEFDRSAFIEVCERRYPRLLNMSIGLFPRMKSREYLPELMSEEKASGLEWVGNPSWIIKRDVLRAWVSSGVKRQQKMSAFLLLGDAEFLKPSLTKGWQQIWAALYFWYYDIAMASLINTKPTWYTNSHQNHFRAVLEATNSLETDQDKLTSFLLIYILRELVLEQKYSNNFRDSFQLLQNMKWLPWELLLINECFQITAEMMQFQNVAERSRGLVRKIKKDLNDENKGKELSPEMKNFLPQLFSKQQLDAYVKQHRLSFWEFGFDEATCSRLALQQLPDMQQDNSANLLVNLSLQDLLTRILRRNHNPNERQDNVFPTNEQMQLLFRTIGENAEKLSARILKEKPTVKNAEKILTKFSQDWQTLYLLQSYPFEYLDPESQSSYTLKQVMALFNNDGEHTSVCQFPSDDVELIWPHLIALLSYVHKYYRRIVVENYSPRKRNQPVNSLRQQFSMKELQNLMVSEVIERLLRDVDSAQLQVYWMLVGEILLEDADFMDKMLSIPAENQEAALSSIAPSADDLKIK